MPRKILVIEDEYQFSEAYRLVFEKEGVSAIFAKNGKEGLEKAISEKPSVILLDLVMPEMDGYTFLEHFKSNNEINKIPLFIMSSLPKSAIESSVPKDFIKGILSKADYTPKKTFQLVKEYL